jgi:hypothetical protein
MKMTPKRGTNSIKPSLGSKLPTLSILTPAATPPTPVYNESINQLSEMLSFHPAMEEALAAYIFQAHWRDL